MNNFKIFLLTFLLFILHFTHSNSAEKIAFLDLDYVVKNSNIGIEVIKKIDLLNNQNLEELQKKQNQLKKLENEIKRKQNIVSSEEIKKEIDNLKNKIKSFNEEKNFMVTEYNNFKNKELDNLMSKINPIIQQYMKKNSIEILLDRKNIYIGDVNSDLTEIIINEINKIN